MSRENKSSSLGVMIILIGLVFLLMNLGVLHFSMFWGIVHLWPFLLVIAGLSILLKGFKHISVILWLAFIGGVIAYSYLNADDKTWSLGESVELEQFFKEINIGDSTGKMDIDINHGNLNISTSEESTVEYEIPESGIKEAFVESELLKNTVLKIEDTALDDLSWDFGEIISNREYNINLPKNDTWDINIDAGALNANLDLADISVTGLDVELGAGSLEVYLGEKSEGTYHVTIAAGDVKIILPEDGDIGIIVYPEGGLHSLDFNMSDFDKTNNEYKSENYDTAKYQITLYVDVTVGRIEVKYE